MISPAVLYPQGQPLCSHPGKVPRTKCRLPVVGKCGLCDEWTCEEHAPAHHCVTRIPA